MLHRPTSKAFRKELLKMYPQLKDKSYMAMFRHLFFNEMDTYWNDGKIVIHHGYLRAMNGIKSDTNSWKSEPFLKDYQTIFPDFRYSDYIHKPNGKGKAREVLNTGIPAHLYKLYEDTADDKVKVFLETGLSVSPRNVKKSFDDSVKFINRTFVADSPHAQRIMDYHNGLSSNAFTKKVNDNLHSAYDVLSNWSDKPQVYKPTMDTLEQITTYPKPLLKPVNNSDRLFAYSPNLNTIKSEVRKALTCGWYEVDMKNAQLAIIAKLWNVPELNSFLSTGKSIWSELLEFLELPASYKPVIKEAIYTLCFGGGIASIIENSNKTFISEGLEPFDMQALLNHPLLVVITERQKEMMTLYAKKSPLNPLTGKPITNVSPQSKLAQMAQAYELLLIHSIYQVQSDTGFQIMIYSFDGLTIAFRDDRSKDYWIERINDAFNALAEALHIQTSLEWEYLAPDVQNITTDSLIDDSVVFSVEGCTNALSDMTMQELQTLSDNDPFCGAHEELQSRLNPIQEVRYSHAPF